MRFSRLTQAICFATTAMLLTACGDDADSTSTTLPDVTPPLLTTDGNFSNGHTAISSVSIAGMAEDDGGVASVTYQLNDEAPHDIPLDITGHFEDQIFLKAGSNKITLTAADNAGNLLNVSKTVYLGDKIAAGNSHTGALREGQLYSWGRNNSGQSGLGITTSRVLDNALNPQHPNTPMLINTAQTKFVSLNFNQNHSLAISEDGRVYSWGDDRFDQLGRGPQGHSSCVSTNDCVLDIGAVDNIDNAVMIATGYRHSLVLTEDGSVWAFGKNTAGQLGDGTTDSSNLPVQVDFSEANNVGRIIQVAASSDSSYALDDKGQVWGWGTDDYANLGRGTACKTYEGCTNVTSKPVRITVIPPATGSTTDTLNHDSDAEKVIQLAAGRDHVLALTSNNSVYGWGLNAQNQVGYKTAPPAGSDNVWEGTITSPTKLPWFENKDVQQVYANGNTSYVLLTNGKLYPWGMFGETNSSGNTVYQELSEPTDKLPNLVNIDNMAMGALHFITQDKDEQLYTWGWSYEGSLGSPDTANVWMYNTPIPISLPSSAADQ